MKTFIVFAFLSSLWGQFEKAYYGFGLDIGSSGSGLFINAQIPLNSKKISLIIFDVQVFYLLNQEQRF